MFFVDLDVEWEKEQLLKDEGAGSSKATLSQWNRLFNVSRHRWTSQKPQTPRILMELESKEEAVLPEPSDVVQAQRSSSQEREGAAPEGAPRVGSPLGAEMDAAALLPTPVPGRLRLVPSTPAFSSSFRYVSLQ
ncbi:uncharacterized protein VSU04_013654 isoform 1-T1 [Chlamydotis macqueenii]